MDEQMKKGVLEMCLLKTISTRESYGYELIQEMVKAFPNLPERTVYTILRRILDNGYTEAFTKDVSAGPPRKYYRITEKGRKQLLKGIEDWQSLVTAVALFGISS